MPISDLASRIARARLEGLRLGQRHGQQQILDFTEIWLHRMGWEPEKIVQYWEDIHALIDEFHDAYRYGMEQDIAQERMDRELREALGDAYSVDFAGRYELVKTAGYDKLPRVKEEKHPALKRRKWKR